MKRVIVDYQRLTNDLMRLLVETYPDGYDDSDIISFRNSRNEAVEAIEVRNDEAIFLVKISKKLSNTMEKFGALEPNLAMEELSKNYKKTAS